MLLSLGMAGQQLQAELAMHEATTGVVSSSVELVARVAKAADLFPYDHNIRRMPAALAAGVSGSMPIELVIPHLEKCLKNDPHARDVQAQLAEARAFLARSRKLQ